MLTHARLTKEIKYHQNRLSKKLKEKYKEAIAAVGPILLIVLILSFTIAPIPASIMLTFIGGAVLLTLGMMFFTLGAELSMTPMGERVGNSMTRSRKLWVMILLGFLLGFIITISEPDLQVLARQVPSIPNSILIGAVAVGVGVFLVIALLRILFAIALPPLLFIFYAVVFILAAFVPKDFLAVAFDSGGVTTGPMTVPFIMALGMGIASIRNDRHADDDSFGLVALSSIGPILSVLILAFVYHASSTYTDTELTQIQNSVDLGQMFFHAFPAYIKEIALSLLPIVIFFAIFQICSLKLEKRALIKILIGLIYTYIGLVMFLTGVNVGFMPAGKYLGQMIAALPYRYILIPIGMLMGYFIVMAEPAVYVLMKQVEELTDGAISGKSLKLCLSIGVAVSVGLSMVRVLTGISIFWFLIPGYAIALGLSLIVPKIFTAIAFDSGGVASGPMTATFLLPFAIGACTSVDGNVVADAFGVVAMVAMTPLITIQILGLVYKFRETEHTALPDTDAPLDLYAELADNAIIEL